MNEQELLKKRISELSHRAYERGYSTFSEFLTPNEISDVCSLRLDEKASFYGGYDNADRCIAGFGDDIESWNYPIACIKISPAIQKFADKLNHRDFLGSLMNLGINRSTLGDIVIKDNVGYLFCLDSISEYIVDSLTRIKHTTVKCEIIDTVPEILNELPEPSEIIVSSQRADVIVASIFKLSRNKATQLFNQEKVFINSRVAYKESLILKENDIVSVRGYGKFIFSSPLRSTKRGKTVAEVRIYK